MDEVDPNACFADLVRLRQLHETYAQLLVIHRQRNFQDLGVARQAFEMFVESEGLSTIGSHRSEDAPTVDKACLAGRQACLLEGKDRIVVEYEWVHEGVPRSSPFYAGNLRLFAVVTLK